MVKRRAPVESYENDGGFVEDAPKSKKSKKDQKQGRKSESKYLSHDHGPSKNQNGELYWEVRGGSSLAAGSYCKANDGKAVENKTHRDFKFQGEHHGEHPRVL